MDLRKIKKLIELLEESSLEEMEISSSDERILLRRPKLGGASPIQSLAPMQSAAESEPVAASPPQRSEEKTLGEPVTSPIVGTYYEAPSPGSKPFISPGKRVAKGDTLCIIEAMKMMNEIKAPETGTVASIEVQNAQAVEFGQVLLYLDT